VTSPQEELVVVLGDLVYRYAKVGQEAAPAGRDPAVKNVKYIDVRLDDFRFWNWNPSFEKPGEPVRQTIFVRFHPPFPLP
jgi:hypothetical protein